MSGTMRTELDVKGMSCGGCAANVQRILSARPGVTAASVDLPAGKASAEYRPDKTGPAELAAALSAAGYGASVAGGGAR